MAVINVTNVTLTVSDTPITTVTHQLLIKIHIEYEGGPGGIQPGDEIVFEVDNLSNPLLDVWGVGTHTLTINGDDPIGTVGTRTYTNSGMNNLLVTITFDDGYFNHFGGVMPGNITGWLETSAQILYEVDIDTPTPTEIQTTVNGISLNIPVTLLPGGPGPQDRVSMIGNIFKYGFYGSHGSPTFDIAEVPDNDYQNFDLFRWWMYVGYQNLTWRNLRASLGERYYTTLSEFAYSTDNPTGANYSSEEEPYIAPYGNYGYGPVNTPYQMNQVVLEDFLIIGNMGGLIRSAHEFLVDSLRIFRVVGRAENIPFNTYEWWELIDSNYVVSAPGERMSRDDVRYLRDHRGLTLQEFLDQMHSEGQMLDKLTVDDLITIDWVPNRMAYGTDPTDERLIPHFLINFGDLNYGDTTATIDVVDTRQPSTVVYANVPAKNLPYAYCLYYDTQAVEAILDQGGFHYRNSMNLAWSGLSFRGDYRNVTIYLEDDSGGTGYHPQIRFKKVDETGESVSGVTFILTQTDVVPPIIREAVTTVNGTASFTLAAGNYVLTEEVPSGSGLVPIAPVHFTVETATGLVNLVTSLEGTSYRDLDQITFVSIDGVNRIVNLNAEPPGAMLRIRKENEAGEAMAEVVFIVTRQEEVF